MKTIRTILFIVLGLFILYVKYSTVPSTATNPASTFTQVQTSDAPVTSGTTESIPPKVLHVLQIVRSTGQPPEGYVGGRAFQNHEGHLPSNGDYREFDVDPHVEGRNAEHIIVEWNTKKAWYTADHYQTFIPLP